MNNKKLDMFSILELMVVILIILLLVSLLVNPIADLKLKAKTALCASNMRQINVLISSYQSDNYGQFPNDNLEVQNGQTIRDLPISLAGNNSFYDNWCGHLMPYIEINLPDRFSRYAMVTKVGTTRYDAAQLGGPPNNPPLNVLSKGWVVIDDAWRKGGYDDLKTFICPEIQQNTFDIAASNKYNGIKIPRILELCNGGVTGNSAFGDIKGYDYGMSGGVPTTYLANSVFFGEGGKNSYRLDQISNISQKAFLLEGGICDTFGEESNGSIAGAYFSVKGSYDTDGGDVSGDNLDKTSPQFHKLNFVHDDFNLFWIMGSQVPLPFPNKNMNLSEKFELALKFNNTFSGKAYMFAGSSTTSGARPLSYSIVSYVYPGAKGEYFDNFFKENPAGRDLNPFVAFVDDPNNFKYLTGNMNVLFGDGSVVKKDQAWLCNNRKSFGLE